MTSYYPFAGRLSKGGGHIDCNDDGIQLLVTHIKGRISDILKDPQIDTISNLFPISGDEAIKSCNIKSLILIQITTLECGGMAIGVCFSHKIGDASSIATFMNDWASTMRNSNHEALPQFDGESFYPSNYDNEMTISPKSLPASEFCSTRRLVFHVPKVDALRNLEKELNPTRFESVSAIICKSIMGSCTQLGLIKPSILNIIVNLRTKMEPPLSENHIGNFALHNLVQITNSETNLKGLLALVKDGMARFRDKFVHRLQGYVYKSYQELEVVVSEGDKEMLLFSSWCRFPFYEVDFGFGKPVWASVFPNPTKNCVFLCDTRDGDEIEAWVSLEDQLMDVLEHDEELLGFASLNPSPLGTH